MQTLPIAPGPNLTAIPARGEPLPRDHSLLRAVKVPVPHPGSCDEKRPALPLVKFYPVRTTRQHELHRPSAELPAMVAPAGGDRVLQI